jgi:hypothetical protein
MPLGNALPFGLRDVRLYPLDNSWTRGTGVDLPVSKTFSFKETVSTAELKGDDVIQAEHDFDPVVDWELEAGGISLEAYVVLSGGTLTTSGTTPSQIKTLSKLRTSQRKYFDVEGQAISDSGGDVHMVVYRCKVTGDLDGKFENGNFFMTKATGKGIGNPTTDKLYDIIQNETAVAITP